MDTPVCWVDTFYTVQHALLPRILGQADIHSPETLSDILPLIVWELPEAVAGSTDIHSCFQPFQTTNHVSPAEEVSLFWHNKLIGLQKSQMSEFVHVPVEKTIL